MGEIAEMMLDGTLCAGCGEALIDGSDDKPQGFPGYCSRECAEGCGVFSPPAPRSQAKARKAERINRERQAAAGRTFQCKSCTKRFRSLFGAEQHHRDVHTRPDPPSTEARVIGEREGKE